MKSKNSVFANKITKLKYQAESYPRIPIVEIVGTYRVLIENHKSIDLYDPKEIVISFKYGGYRISGCNLTVAYMSKHKIVICGDIACVECIKGDDNGNQ